MHGYQGIIDDLKREVAALREENARQCEAHLHWKAEAHRLGQLIRQWSATHHCSCDWCMRHDHEIGET